MDKRERIMSPCEPRCGRLFLAPTGIGAPHMRLYRGAVKAPQRRELAYAARVQHLMAGARKVSSRASVPGWCNFGTPE